jgi:ribosome-associated protein
MQKQTQAMLCVRLSLCCRPVCPSPYFGWQAQGIWGVRVSHLTYTTEFFINCHGTSRPMLQAIAGSVEDVMLEKYDRPIKWQGNPDSGWILLDYGEVIVNVMTEQAREFYDIEHHWSNGELIPLEGLVTPMDEYEAKRLSSAAFDFVDEADWGAGGADPFADWDKLDDNKEDDEWDGVWGKEDEDTVITGGGDGVASVDSDDEEEKPEEEAKSADDRKVSKRFKDVL